MGIKGEKTYLSVLESAAEQSELEVVLRCKNDVCIGALSVNFTVRYFMWFVSFSPFRVTRLLLSNRISLFWLLINGTVVREGEREKRNKRFGDRFISRPYSSTTDVFFLTKFNPTTFEGIKCTVDHFFLFFF